MFLTNGAITKNVFRPRLIRSITIKCFRQKGHYKKCSWTKDKAEVGLIISTKGPLQKKFLDQWQG
jgi:hypothetical protein